MRKKVIFSLLFLVLLFFAGCNPQASKPENPLAKLYRGSILTVPEMNKTITINKRVTEFGQMGNQNDPFGSVAFIERAIELPRNVIVTFFAYNNGGSGDLIYLAAFAPKGNSYAMTDAVFLGDRVKLETLTNNQNQVTVTYKNHAPDQAMVDEPKVAVKKIFDYQSGKLVERK